MNDHDYEELLQATKAAEPPPLDQVATERIWKAVEARAFPVSEARLPRFVWPLATAASLLVGLAAGYQFGVARVPADEPVVLGAARVEANVSPTTEYLRDAATLLIPLAGEATPVLTPAMQDQARELLATTRLVLDAGLDDQSLRGLLEDLELVLAQMVPVAGGSDDAEARFVSQALVARAVVPRLTTVLSSAGGGD